MKDKAIIARVTKSTHRDFKVACAQLGVTMSAVVEDAIDATIIRAAAEREKRDE